MRTALILAFAANGKVSLLSEPSVPFDEQRERWAEITTLEEHPEQVIRYEFWTAERGLQKKFTPGEVNALHVTASAKGLKQRSEEKDVLKQKRKENPEPAAAEDPKFLTRHADLLKKKNALRGGGTRSASPTTPPPTSAPAGAPSPLPGGEGQGEGAPQPAKVPDSGTVAWDEQRKIAAANTEAPAPVAPTTGKKKK